MKKDAFMTICRSKHTEPLTVEQEAFYGGIAEGIEKAFTENSVERGKQLQELTDKIGTVDEGQSIASVVRALAQKVDEVEAQSRSKFSASEAYKLKRALEGKKDEIIAVMRNRGQAWGLEFKARRAASDLMTTSTVVTGAVGINTDNVFDDVELTVIRYPANFIGDAINSRQVSNVPYSIKWKEQKAESDGRIGVITEGSEKTLVDKAFEWKYAYRQKYAGRIEFTEETEMDFEQLTLDIIDMFESDVLRAYNAGLLAAIFAWAPAYVTSAMAHKLVKPNIMNVVNAGKLVIAANNYTADTLIINPADYAESQNMQNSLGDPIFVPDNVLFPGLKLFVTNNIVPGTILLGEGGIVKEQHGSYIVRSGQYGNQLIENEKTIIGEIFSVLKLPTESSKGWCKLVVATVKTDLDAAV